MQEMKFSAKNDLDVEGSDVDLEGSDVDLEGSDVDLEGSDGDLQVYLMVIWGDQKSLNGSLLVF